MFWGDKCPHEFLPRDLGTENGFYWQMANSNVRRRMFLVGLAYPGLAKIKKECAEHTMASVVELGLRSTFSHSCIQLGFISLGHFGWFFFWEEPHQRHTREEFSKNVVWLCSTICSHGQDREGSSGESTCIPRSQRHLIRSILVLLRNMECLWNEGNPRGVQENPSCILSLNL